MLNQHLRKAHEMVMDNEYLNFTSETEFKVWKGKIEEETRSTFMQQVYLRNSGKQNLFIFIATDLDILSQLAKTKEI